MEKPNFDFIQLREKVAAVKESAVDVIKKGSETISDRVDQARQDFDVWKNKPLFLEDIESEDYVLPKMIQVVDYDERTEKEALQDAIGFDESTDNVPAITVLSNKLNYINASFYPEEAETVYYVDPVNPNKYIDINNYFAYAQAAKVTELKEIAEALGATYIKITFKEEKKVFVSTKNKKRQE